ncbi:MAG: hypothetical protein ACE5Q6_05340, partial [Dehalococcoidia bacterium]
MALWQASNWAWVAEDYEIGPDRHIRALWDPSRMKFYDPWQVRQLPAELARVQPGVDDSALGFVQKWGLTGSVLCGAGPEPQSLRRQLSEDTLEWLECHGAVMRFALGLINLVRERVEARVTQYLSTEWPKAEGVMSPVLLDEQMQGIRDG